MRDMVRIFLLLWLLPTTWASAAMPPISAPGCRVTSVIATKNYPGADAIPNINSLQLPAGKAVEAEGQKIIITGRVLDRACIPVADARVEIWQNDPFGRWILADANDLVSVRPVFTGAGRTYSDNNGVFMFTTLFPAAMGEKQAPHFYIRIVADGAKDFSTMLYFSGDARNASDRDWAKLPPIARQSVAVQIGDRNAAPLKGGITIVLPEKMHYRGY